MKRLVRLVVVSIAAFLITAPVPAFASAWGAWAYELTVPSGYGTWADYCVRAGMINTASNRVDMQTHTNGCSSSSRTVKSGYLGGKVAGYRDGAYCGITNALYSNTATWGFAVASNVCSNPSGTQAFHTLGYGAIYNDGSQGGATEYTWFTRTSPSQNY